MEQQQLTKKVAKSACRKQAPRTPLVAPVPLPVAEGSHPETSRSTQTALERLQSLQTNQLEWWATVPEAVEEAIQTAKHLQEGLTLIHAQLVEFQRTKVLPRMQQRR